MKLKQSAKKAVLIGSMCSLSYLAVYVARNVLGAVSPQMIEQGTFITEAIGTLSSLYFITYAVGQLINGAIGDRIKAKYMISVGLILAGLCNYLFSVIPSQSFLSSAIYALTGFGLSMIYAPMTKVVAENTEPIYATRCSLGYTFASYFGSPVAGILAALMMWRMVFWVSSGVLILMGCVCFAVFTAFEKKGIVKYGQFAAPKSAGGNIKALLERQIIKYTLISVLTGIVRTSVVFWLPTYISQHLSYTSDEAAMLYTVSTVIISSSAFVAVFLFERLKRNLDLTVLASFAGAAVCFGLVFAVRHPVINLIFMVMAILASNCASSMLWSRYCPSLRDTGITSGATGFLDFMSYVAAAISSVVFANAVSGIGWSGLILVWLGLMVIGVVIALPYKKSNRLPI